MNSKKTYLYGSDFTVDSDYDTFDNTWERAFRYTVPQNYAIKLSKDRPLNMMLPCKEEFTGSTDEVADTSLIVAGSKFYYDSTSGALAFAPSNPFVPATVKNAEVTVHTTSNDALLYRFKLDSINTTTKILYFSGDTGLTFLDSQTIRFHYLPTNGTLRLVIVNPDAEPSSMTKVIFEQSVSEFNLVEPYDPIEVLSLIEEVTLIDYYHLDLYMKANWELDFTPGFGIIHIPIIKQVIMDQERRQLRPIVQAQFTE